MEDLQTAQLAAGMLDEQNTAVRYWAVHAVTNPVIAAKLNAVAEENPDLVKQIAQKLKDQLTKENSPEILSLIIDFAGNLKGSRGRELLLVIADKRIQQYENWTVDNELLDNAVLINLCEAVISQREGKAEVARRFAQLYSFAMQRYIQSIDNETLLDSSQKQQLASVLVEVEQKCIGKLTEITQSAIRSAVERDRSAALLAEHNSLFGSENTIGRLIRALDFDYGQNPDGTRRSIPRILPPRS
jgi:hypothetical protein